MSEINLEDLMAAKSSSPPDSEPAAADLQPAEPQLSPEDLQQIQSIMDSINLLDSNTPYNFGSSTQKNLADFSNSILNNVRSKDSGHVGELLNSLVSNVNGFNPNSNKSVLSKIPFFGSLIDKSNDFVQGFSKLSTQVDKISNALDNSKIKLLEDIALFDQLYQKNLDYFHQLNLYIIAGDKKLAELRNSTLPKLQAQAQQSNDPLAVQLVNDFQLSCDRFEKKIHDLKLSKTIALQTAPQIRLIQNNDKLLIDRIQAAIFHTIPLWKNQIVIALGLSNQQAVIQLQRAVNDATNDLLLKNAQLLKQNSIDSAKENERSVVDIQTIKKVNDELIDTIQQTLKIQRDAHQHRLDAEKQLINIEANLKAALLGNYNAN